MDICNKNQALTEESGPQISGSFISTYIKYFLKSERLRN